MSRIEELNKLMEELEVELVKFYDKGNKAAGTRAREQLQELKKLSQDIRLGIQEIKNNEGSALTNVSKATFCGVFCSCYRYLSNHSALEPILIFIDSFSLSTACYCY